MLGAAVDVDDGELPDHMFQGLPPVAVDEGLLETGFGQGGVDVVPLAVPAGGMDVVLGKIAVQQAVQGEGRGLQVIPGIGHEPEHPPVLVHQGILLFGVQGIGKWILGVADPVVQEHGLAGVRVDEQVAPEGRGMEGEAVCGQLFFSKAAQPGGDAWIGIAPGVHGKKLLKAENKIIILMSGNSQLTSQCHFLSLHFFQQCPGFVNIFFLAGLVSTSQ